MFADQVTRDGFGVLLRQTCGATLYAFAPKAVDSESQKYVEVVAETMDAKLGSSRQL